MIRFQCPSCAKHLKVADSLAGKTGTCPGCRFECSIPAAPKQGFAQRIAGGVVKAVRIRHEPVEFVQPVVTPRPASIWAMTWANAWATAWANAWASAVTRVLIWLILVSVLLLLGLLVDIAWRALDFVGSRAIPANAVQTPLVNTAKVRPVAPIEDPPLHSSQAQLLAPIEAPPTESIRVQPVEPIEVSSTESNSQTQATVNGNSVASVKMRTIDFG